MFLEGQHNDDGQRCVEGEAELKETFSTFEAAKIIDVKPKTVGIWINRGYIKPYKKVQVTSKTKAHILNYKNLFELMLLKILGDYSVPLSVVKDSLFHNLESFINNPKLNPKKKSTWEWDYIVLNIGGESIVHFGIHESTKHIEKNLNENNLTLVVNIQRVKKILDGGIKKILDIR